MRSAALLALVAILVGGCAGGPEVRLEYDHHTDFTRYRTYSWVVADSVPFRALMWAHFVDSVERELARKGFEEVESQPDVHVSIFAGVSSETVVDTNVYGYSYGPGWYYGEVPAGSGSTVRKYTRGTLVVDLWDAATKRLAWRGTATDITSDDPAVNAEKIRVAVERMFQTYPPSGAP